MNARYLAATTVLAALSLSAEAFAGGFLLAPQNTRGMGRGGAYVAGSDGPDAFWYNPANIGAAGTQAELGANLNLLSARFTRVDEWGAYSYEEVGANAAPLPIPTLGYVTELGVEGLSVGGGLVAPSASLFRWPETVTTADGPAPAPQRYSLITMAGSMLSMPTIALAYEPVEGLRFGISGYALTGTFRASMVLSGCDGGATCLYPEDPEYDTRAEVSLENIFAPTLGAGVTYEAGAVTAAASVMLPYVVEGDATLSTQLPSAALFDGATLEGDTAHMAMRFPLIARAGVEVGFTETARAELALVYEGWHVQDEIAVEPNDVWIRGITGIGDYQVGPLSIPRHMEDVWSVRAGGEYDPRPGLTVRGGGDGRELGVLGRVLDAADARQRQGGGRARCDVPAERPGLCGWCAGSRVYRGPRGAFESGASAAADPT